MANVITSTDTKRSAIASDARNKFPIRLKLLSVYIAIHTKMFPAADKNIIVAKNVPKNGTK